MPLRICVTGTRGKSSTVRLITAVLRENGKKTIAKTTGSEAQYIYPDGTAHPVKRRGIPSIIEQKQLFEKAAQLHAECVVAEIMSIHPENHSVESQQIIKPHIVIITNIRPDHIDAMGKTTDEIAAVLALTITDNAVVFIPEKEIKPPLLTAITEHRAKLVSVCEGKSAQLIQKYPNITKTIFPEILDIILTISEYLNIPENIILSGIQSAQFDIGAFSVRECRLNEKQYYFVNAFAANDPQSTAVLLQKTNELLPPETHTYIGLLNLRADRADRTIQWIQALSDGASGWFKKLFLVGAHTHIVKRRVQNTQRVKTAPPGRILEQIFSQTDSETVIFGFGNIGGMGKLIAEYWNTIGKPYGI